MPGQNPGRSSRGDSVVLRLQSVMMVDVWWCRSVTGIGYLKEFCFQSWVESSRGECERRIGEIKRWVRRMFKLTEVFWESVPKSWCSVGKRAVAELQRGWDWRARQGKIRWWASRPWWFDGEKLANARGLRGLKSVVSSLRDAIL